MLARIEEQLERIAGALEAIVLLMHAEPTDSAAAAKIVALVERMKASGEKLEAAVAAQKGQP
jgi:hypothetical protein